MTDEPSFDPKSWGKTEPTPPRSSSEALPEAFRGIVAPSGQPASPHPTEAIAPARKAGEQKAQKQPRTGEKPGSSAAARSLIGPALSLAILGAGAAAAWLMRAPPIPAAGDLPETAAASPVAPGETRSVRRLVLAGPADLRDALIAAGVPAAEAETATRETGKALGAAAGEIRMILTLAIGGDGTHIDRMEVSRLDGSGAAVTRDAAGVITASAVAAELSKQIRVVSGELDADSFYSSAVSAGLIDSLIPDFINAFAFDFNLASEVSPGDTFEVAYETTVNAAGDPVGEPQLVYASLTTPAKSRTLYRFKSPEGEFGWYDGNGASTVRSFMRTPVDGARISSKFGMRFHPVLHYNKLHGGTDFAAPIGTPIFAAGNAVVDFAAMKGPNGNLTVLRHDNGWQTLYLHQNMFMPDIAPGARVIQGQKIGEIGTTGRSTGPHLHYEVHVDGERVDPLEIKTDSGRKALEGSVLAAFRQARDRVDIARAQYVK
ncbi:peptidoglycan DD-metalloendopeptidase family protein [Novosphingobium sp. Chol11]|uniref:peptidoglycan DD-metalloendopeptidase family protein n=1 Tax=Novosphingobium sp. Chol11 TaxID=1385763 RepID=UPI0025D01A8F|nr:peptidoglycan DD-metalloendopeptidase family protein [Novosphingobium sp. Chol11]